MEKTEDEFKMAGKSLLITAKVDGFRRGGICHSATETLHSVSEFTPEQLAQIMAENEKELIVKVVEVKRMEGGSQPPGRSGGCPRQGKGRYFRAGNGERKSQCCQFERQSRL